MILRGLVVVFYTIIAIAFAGTSYAKEAPPRSKLVAVKFISPSGSIEPVPWPNQSDWVWEKTSESSKILHPVLRTWVVIPENVKLRSMRAQAAQIREDSTDSPLKEFPGKTLQIDASAPVATATIQFENDRGQVNELSLLIESKNEEPLLLIHPSCIQQGIDVSPIEVKTNHLFLGLWCDESKDSFKLYIHQSFEINWVGSSLDKEGAVDEQDAKWTRFHFNKPVNANYAVPIEGNFEIALKKDQRIHSKYQLTYSPKVFRSPFSLEIGAGASYFFYKEDPLDARVRDAAFFAKLVANYTLAPALLDVGASLTSTVWNFYHRPKTSLTPRYYTAEPYLGVHLPFRIKFTTLKFLAGFYYSGMQVDTDQNTQKYGLKRYYGPSFTLSGRVNPFSKPFWGYLKFIPLDKKILKNHIVGIGANYQLSSRFARRQWGIFGDLSYGKAETQKTGTQNTFKMMTYSLGVSTYF